MAAKSVALALAVAACCCTIVVGQSNSVAPAPHNDLLDAPAFLQIPGPNPILQPGSDGWDSSILETAGIFKDFGTYYLYYHATGEGPGYQVGVATSNHPLGPFKKHDGNPILKLGAEGSWENMHVANAIIIKEGLDKYFMWYCGKNTHEKDPEGAFGGLWHIGLATASHPLGPWKKHEGNPIIRDFGYNSATVKVEGKYYLYSAYPIDSTGPDYSPMALATADRPEGPWTKYEGNPILKPGEAGEWDDGGFSDAAVVYSAGVFHMFFSGAKTYTPRILTRESLGYAYSFDGIHFRKYARNPIATREADPNAASFSEPRVLMEMPFIYVYHTLRYKEPLKEQHKQQFPMVEDLGVQVLVTQRPFKLDMPVLQLDRLAPGATTELVEGRSVALSMAKTAAVTVAAKFQKDASAGLRIHVRSSPDGLNYDTADYATLNLQVTPGETVRQTFKLEPHAKFVKFIVENNDATAHVRDVRITVTLGG